LQSELFTIRSNAKEKKRSETSELRYKVKKTTTISPGERCMADPFGPLVLATIFDSFLMSIVTSDENQLNVILRFYLDLHLLIHMVAA
jgi:hypothetical protein